MKLRVAVRASNKNSSYIYLRKSRFSPNVLSFYLFYFFFIARRGFGERLEAFTSADLKISSKDLPSLLHLYLFRFCIPMSTLSQDHRFFLLYCFFFLPLLSFPLSLDFRKWIKLKVCYLRLFISPPSFAEQISNMILLFSQLNWSIFSFWRLYVEGFCVLSQFFFFFLFLYWWNQSRVQRTLVVILQRLFCLIVYNF